MLERLNFETVVNSPFTWAAGGFVVAFALGVNAISVWLLTAGFVAYLYNLRRNGDAQPKTEGWLFAEGPAMMTGWVFGFMVRGIIF